MGTLYIVSTPIGNLKDITLRAIETLQTVDYIACEDTRRTGILLKEYPHKAMLIPLHEHNELNATAQIVEYLETGRNVALVSDAGTPLMSDPGFLLVREARKRGIPVASVPGASAAIAALSVSGLPTNTFTFLGYPPEKQSHRVKLFENLLTMKQLNNTTIVFYCAPHKLEQTLLDMKEIFGDIEITIARELTKIHEEVFHGKISVVLSQMKDIKGEIVLLFTLPEE